MGLISSLNTVMAGLVNPRATDISGRPIGKTDAPAISKPVKGAAEANAQLAAQAREVWVNRTFNSSLQAYHSRQVSEASGAGAQVHFFNRLQALFGTEGAGSLETRFAGLQGALQGLSANPENPQAAAELTAQAEAMTQALHRFSINIRDMRQQANAQIASVADRLNGTLRGLAAINTQIQDHGTRPALIDQRDRLVSALAELIDIKADYKPDGTVALTSGGRLGLLGGGVARFEMDNGETLTLTPPSGKTLELSQPGAIQSGELGGLLAMRDRTLFEAQAQLDEIAAGLAQAFSTVETPAEAVNVVNLSGFDIDVSAMQPGDEILLTYTDYSDEQRLRLVNTGQGLDYIDVNGQRVLGLDLSAEIGDVATALSELLPRFKISSTGEDTLRVLGSGATGGIVVNAALTRTTSIGGLFADAGGRAFINDLDADPMQKSGFAGRITLNDAASPVEPNVVLAQLNGTQIVSGQLNGNVRGIIGQTVAIQGDIAARGLWRHDERQMMLNAANQQMAAAPGSNVNAEMGKLLDLENMFAANAQVILVFKDLMDTL